MVNFTIDGKLVTAEEGTYILQVARANNIDIPTLCYHPALEPCGVCRLCTVEAISRGKKRLVTSCNYPVEEGLEIRTDSEEVIRARRMIVEMLLARCPNVEVIQGLAKDFGVEKPRFKLGDDNCILCGLCARVCEERMGVSAISFVGRGLERKIDTPFHIQSEVCMACGACAFVCPTGAIKLEDITKKDPRPILAEFNSGLGSRSAIYLPFPQAVPKVPVIDRESCIHFLKGDCRICESVCQPGAIKYDQEDEFIEVEVGAIIMATGFDLYDPSGLEEYGYGKIKNVITAIQYERMISASGPTGGQLKRPSDGKRPEKLAFIQCVGSRDTRHKPYCSSVCCMHATKEAILGNEHYPDLKSFIFYTDLRAVGKRFQEYITRAKQEYNVTYIRGRPSKITEDSETTNPVVWHEETTAKKINRMEVDMVILCQALIPSDGHKEIGDMLGLNLSEHGFVHIPDRLFHPVDTDVPGIFACGLCQSPQDIPDSVVQASTAAARAAEFITKEATK
ncbi:2Fe-2S iron-sulfur cluster-binding protein [Chloroflexota bacterium]